MRKFVLAAVLVLVAGGAQAATLNVVGGILHGASGVLVDGSLYDVQFLGGDCISLYSGCDDVSDFTFQTQASAILASQALLDQVFLDGVDGLFDSGPFLRSAGGCYSSFCTMLIPFDEQLHLNHYPFEIAGVKVTNNSSSVDDIYSIAYFPRSGWLEPYISPENPLPACYERHTAEFPCTVGYAVWSPSVVPEPSTALLLGLGLTGLAAKGRRSLRS